jgi:hypothetical protein
VKLWAYNHRQAIAVVYALIALTVVLTLQILETSGVIR